jgi:hypothetical protein
MKEIIINSAIRRVDFSSWPQCKIDPRVVQRQSAALGETDMLERSTTFQVYFFKVTALFFCAGGN